MEILDGEALRRIEAEMASRAAEPAAPAEPDDPDAEARAAAAMGLRAAPTVVTPASSEKRAERAERDADPTRDLRLACSVGAAIVRRLDPRSAAAVRRVLNDAVAEAVK